MSEDLLDRTEDFSRPEDPAYVRRQRRSGARKGGFRRTLARHWKELVVGLLIAGITAFAAREVLRFLHDDPRFRVASVEIHGQRFVSLDQVEKKFLPDRERSLLWVPLQERRRAIEQIPWVRSAAVRRVLPGRLWVSVEERTPVAFLWTPAGLALVDGEGVVLEPPPEASFTLPVVRGVTEREPPAQRRAKMQRFASVLQELRAADARASEQISEMHVGDAQDLRVVLADEAGAILLHLGKEDFAARFLTYLNHAEEWKTRFTNLQSVDLRYDGQAVINADPQGGGAPSSGHSVAIPPPGNRPADGATTNRDGGGNPL